ncbi:MAG: aromatic ring-hydroxylating dioxygenase subunit alpha [Conexivisphaerales archaeon]
MKSDPVISSCFHVVARSTDLPEGGTLSVKACGEDILIWRSNSIVHAWKDLCIHRGARLSLGSVHDSTLTCAYHGWTYDEQGKCIRIPAHPEQEPPSKARAEVFHAEERFGLIWVCTGTPARKIPDFPEWKTAGYRMIHCGPYHVRASAPRVVENFLDVAHLPFVHEGLLGDRMHANIDDYDVSISEDGITASGVRIWQPNPDGTGVASEVIYTYRVFTPFTCYFVKESSSRGFAIYCSVTPIDTVSSAMWMIIAMNYGHETADNQIREFEDRVVAQDISIVESQRPEFLPLDLQAELHLRSDKTAIAYRKWLGQLGLTFGTA